MDKKQVNYIKQHILLISLLYIFPMMLTSENNQTSTERFSKNEITLIQFIQKHESFYELRIAPFVDTNNLETDLPHYQIFHYNQPIVTFCSAQAALNYLNKRLTYRYKS